MGSARCFAEVEVWRTPGQGPGRGIGTRNQDGEDDMPATIRLQRVGRKAQGSFRIVVSDQAESRDGPAIETIGTYNPRTHPSAVRLDAAAALSWLHDGAQPTNTVISIFRKTGVWQKVQAGELPDSLEETIVTLGPEGGMGKTSSRAETAARAWAESEADRKVRQEAAAAAAAKAAEARAETETAEAEEQAIEAQTADEAEAEAAPQETDTVAEGSPGEEPMTEPEAEDVPEPLEASQAEGEPESEAKAEGAADDAPEAEEDTSEPASEEEVAEEK